MGNIVNATISLAIELTDYSVPAMESALATNVCAIPVGQVMRVIVRLRILRVCLLVSQSIKKRTNIILLASVWLNATSLTLIGGGDICSGNGICNCGTCQCSSIAQGKYCENCPVINDEF